MHKIVAGADACARDVLLRAVKESMEIVEEINRMEERYVPIFIGVSVFFCGSLGEGSFAPLFAFAFVCLSFCSDADAVILLLR